MAVVPYSGHRLLSLDFYRGLIMVLLMLEAAGLYEHLIHYTGMAVWIQFTHHPWHGLRFWDLIQPGFMFIAGTAMALSLEKQWASGKSWYDTFEKMLRRCWWLFFWGVLNYAVRPEGLSFELWNVLTQLSFTLMVAFLIYRWPVPAQLGFSVALLGVIELLYRFSEIPGFDRPFTNQQNFGNYVDLLLMNKINGGGWVAINCVPTAAHTIWGAVAGKWLLSVVPSEKKIQQLVAAGAACLVIGYGLDFAATPIIKRIATSSFTFVSGGWCLLGLAVFYWWIDVRGHRRHLTFFTVVGMNAIFIYLFFEIVGHRWFNGYIGAITEGLFFFLPAAVLSVFTSLVIFGLEWAMCYFLFRRNLFFKL